MENVMSAIAYGMTVIVSLVLFVIVIKTLIPAFLLKVKYSLDAALGRGCKKFTYPTGRAVLYEPHPSVRKYINKYLLLVNDGYKYLKCYVDLGVKNLKFNVIMFNNKDKVIDVVSVTAQNGASSQLREVLLHPDTSYVALDLETANGYDVKRLVSGYYTLLQLACYFAAVLFATFFELLYVSGAIENVLFYAISRNVSLGFAVRLYFVFSMFVAAVALGLVIIYSSKKRIGVVIHGKK